MEQSPEPSAPAPVRIPRKSALAFYGVLLLLLLPGLLAQSAQPVLGLAWTEIFAFLLPAVVGAAGSNLRAGAYLRLVRVRPAVVALGALAGGAGYLLAGSVMLATERLLPRHWVNTFDLGRLFEGPAWERVALSALAALVAPVCEEVAFRGYVQTTLALRRRPGAAIAGAALLFASMHLDPVRFPALILLGVTFGWLAWRAGSIWPAIVAHAVNNGVASGLVLAAGAPPPEPPPWREIAAPFALGAAALALLLGAYRAATPRPPPAQDAIALRDPAWPALPFSPARVPPRLAAVAIAGIVLLAGVFFVAMLNAAPAPRTSP